MLHSFKTFYKHPRIDEADKYGKIYIQTFVFFFMGSFRFLIHRSLKLTNHIPFSNRVKKLHRQILELMKNCLTTAKSAEIKKNARFV